MKKFSAVIAVIVFTMLLFNFTNTAEAKTWERFSDVPLQKEWKIKFNRHIDPASVTDKVELRQVATNAKLQITTVVEDNTLYVKPAQALQHHTDYILTIGNGIHDLQGKQMKTATTVPFTTKASANYKTLESEYQMDWKIDASQYTNFYLVGSSQNKDVGGYETRKGTSIFGIAVGASAGTVQQKYGQPLESIRKGNTQYIQNYTDNYGNTTSGTYLIDDYYVTFFYDIHKNNIVRSVQWVSAATEATKPTFFRTNITENYRVSQEELMVHLINEARVAEGLDPLTYTPQYNSIARQHSADMAAHNYFSHTDRNGNDAGERMQAGNLRFSWYGENLAYGQYSAIHAHEALMNSAGHRANILRPNFTHVFVGAEYKSDGTPYFTINFYRP